MNRLLMVAALLVLAGCASDRANMRAERPQLDPADAYVQAVERLARDRGVEVRWVHKPSAAALAKR